MKRHMQCHLFQIYVFIFVAVVVVVIAVVPSVVWYGRRFEYTMQGSLITVHDWIEAITDWVVSWLSAIHTHIYDD